jgi:orotidine-5'-phosphate decarboxylase
MTDHNFVQLARAQRLSGTLYCGGLDPHPFGTYQKNMDVYGAVPKTSDIYEDTAAEVYHDLASLMFKISSLAQCELAEMLATVENYIRYTVRVLVEDCNVAVLKPQAGFYEQFGPAGSFLLQRIRQYISHLEKEFGIRLICILDCKKGDIATTQAGYFRGLLGNLMDGWGINYEPYGFDIINPTPWMGEDVLVLGTKEKPDLGLRLLREGKGLIYVNKTSNPSGPQYQELATREALTVQMINAIDAAEISKNFELEEGGLSQLGLVVGSTHPCDGSIRRVFPLTTLLVPGFVAQGGKFSLIMPELIREGEWAGQGAIFSSSRGTLYPWEKKYGGSGNPRNLREDLIAAISNFRKTEKEAYAAAGIQYPFSC